jgi:hypothetical protein
MNSQSNNSNQIDNDRQDLIAFVRPIRISLVENSEGWNVTISSLNPGDAMMALTRDDSFEQSTILCGAGATNWVACVNGPIEMGDANAIIASISSSNSPLAAECRMNSMIASVEQGGISAHVRVYDDALALVAESFRQYASNLLNCNTTTPDLGLMATLFERGDEVSVRPIESEVFSTFLDIGISSSPGSAAEQALVYDIHSDTWHGD